MDEPEGDIEPAAHPAGVGLHDAVSSIRDADELEQLIRPRLQRAAAHPLHAALEHQVLTARAELVDARVLRHVPDQPANRVLLAAHVVPEDRRCAFVGVRERDEYAYRRRLAGAVRAEETEDLALADLERHAVERSNLAVRLTQLADGDRIHRRRG